MVVTNSLLTLKVLQKMVAEFRDERNWKQHHNPKNLAISILVEAAELAEHFQWETPEKVEEHKNNAAKKREIAFELADGMNYCLSLADIMEIDLGQAVVDKLKYCEKKFPKDKVNDLEFIRKQREEYRRLG